MQIQQMVPGDPTESSAINQRFGKENSPIVVEVTDDTTPIVIDLDKAGN